MNMISNVDTRQDVWDITAAGVKCVILAPTTMLTQQGKRVKTDARDALMIARVCLIEGIMLFIFSHRKMIL